VISCFVVVGGVCLAPIGSFSDPQGRRRVVHTLNNEEKTAPVPRWLTAAFLTLSSHNTLRGLRYHHTRAQVLARSRFLLCPIDWLAVI